MYEHPVQPSIERERKSCLHGLGSVRMDVMSAYS